MKSVIQLYGLVGEPMYLFELDVTVFQTGRQDTPALGAEVYSQECWSVGQS